MIENLCLSDIEETHALIAPFVTRTPVHDWTGREIDSRLSPGTHVNLKLELFQRSGTFKPRGALSVMLRLSDEQRRSGVTAVSAGNHAIATAYAASRLGISAKVVMLPTASAARRARCRAYGAEILIAESGKAAFELAEALARDEGRSFIHPFEGPLTALGTATLGLEWLSQADDLEAVIIPIGGGGLCAGVSSAIKLLRPDCRVYGVEPVGADSMHQSIALGRPVDHVAVSTIADSLGPPFALPYSFELCRRHVDRFVKVDDDQIRDAMALLSREMKLMTEPAGAVATAALLGPLRDELRGCRTGVLVCGSNIDIGSFASMIQQAEKGAAL